MPRVASITPARDVNFKIILLGDQFVGKTSIFLRLKDNEFPMNRVISTGMDVFTKKYHIDGHNVALTIQDTAGVERFRSLTRSYYRDVSACVLVFSVDNRISFEHLAQWKQDADYFLDSPANKFVTGNKVDLENDTCVPEDLVRKFTKEFNDLDDKVYYTSAKTGEGVEVLFRTVATKLLKQQDRKLMDHESFDNSTSGNKRTGKDLQISSPTKNKECKVC